MFYNLYSTYELFTYNDKRGSPTLKLVLEQITILEKLVLTCGKF